MQETIGDKVLDYSYTSGGQIVSVRYKANTNTEDKYYYYALNSRGDVVGLYDENGALYAKYTYDVWGNPISVKNASGANLPSDDIANIQSLRYRGYYYDSDTGFYYLQSRYYDPVTHRFINADSLLSTGTGVLGYNMFSYCNNNPIMYIDKTGNDTVIVEKAKRLNSGLDCDYDITDITLMQLEASMNQTRNLFYNYTSIEVGTNDDGYYAQVSIDFINFNAWNTIDESFTDLLIRGDLSLIREYLYSESNGNINLDYSEISQWWAETHMHLNGYYCGNFAEYCSDERGFFSHFDSCELDYSEKDGVRDPHDGLFGIYVNGVSWLRGQFY